MWIDLIACSVRRWYPFALLLLFEQWMLQVLGTIRCFSMLKVLGRYYVKCTLELRKRMG